MKFGKKKDKESSAEKDNHKESKKEKKSKDKKKASETSKGGKEVKKVFGGPLPIFGDEIPQVIRDTTEYMEKYGLTTPGIFRESGSLQQINLYRSQYEKGETPSFNPLEPHVVASLLKAYLRELKDPLLTFEHYDMFIACESINDEKVKLDVIKKVIKCLPEYNIKLTKFICKFLLKVTEFSDQNKMTPDTLSIVFLPTILRPKANSDQEVLQYTVEDQKSSKTLMSSILLNYDEIFEDPSMLPVKSRQTRAHTEFVSPSSSYGSNKTPLSNANSPLSTSPNDSPLKSTTNSSIHSITPLSTSPIPFNVLEPTENINQTTTSSGANSNHSSPPLPPLPTPPTTSLPPLPSLPKPPLPNQKLALGPPPPLLVVPPKPIPKLPNIETRGRSNTTFA